MWRMYCPQASVHFPASPTPPSSQARIQEPDGLRSSQHVPRDRPAGEKKYGSALPSGCWRALGTNRGDWIYPSSRSRYMGQTGIGDCQPAVHLGYGSHKPNRHNWWQYRSARDVPSHLECDGAYLAVQLLPAHRIQSQMPDSDIWQALFRPDAGVDNVSLGGFN